jgi:hypothetical protein
MRDPNRIDGILAQVAEIWKQYPDLRLGQLILNLHPGNPAALYNLEDEALVRKLTVMYDVGRWWDNGPAS